MKENNSNKKKNGFIALGLLIFLACIVVFGSGPLYKVIDDRARPEIYTPGTYTGSAKGYGGMVTAQVKVSKNRIESIDVSGEKETHMKKVLPRLTDAIIEKQSTQVDSVSGATLTSQAIKGAVDKALHQASGEAETAGDTETKSES